MIAYINGVLEHVAEDHVVIDVNGIGYQVFVPGQVLEQLSPVGSQLKMHTYFLVREDAMLLYGFLSLDDLEVFKALLSVNGIGPKGALAVLSVLTTSELRFAILGDDASAIAKAPGIGPKTAKRIILELKDKVSLEDAMEVPQALGKQPDVDTAAVQSVRNEAVAALTALGYSSSEAFKAVCGVEITDEMDTQAVLKLALKQMSIV